MANIEDLLRKRKELIDEIDKQIKENYTRPVTLLFTDIVGSTRYFETMGDIRGRQMIQIHNDLLFPIIKIHMGIIIKTIGDSIMASFEDPLQSVICAIEMQKKLAQHNENQQENQKIKVRMGLHFGEAVVDGQDLFGDMVNTSARVEARADADEIIISSSLKAKLADADLPLVFLGSDFVKGKDQKIDFFLVNWNNRKNEDIVSSWQSRSKTSSTGPKAAIIKQKVKLKTNIDLKQKAKQIQPLAKRGNPYLNRVMIPHPDMFFGRKSIIKRIMQRISSQSPQSVSIIGERRIGKSSLLNYLNFATTRLSLLDVPEEYIFLFIDFQQLRSMDTKELIAVLYKELEKQLTGNIEISLKADFDGMLFLCEEINSSGFKFIMLFDEFESVTKNQKIKADFYSFFRSLANNYKVAFITTSARNLKDMCVSHEISDSPFFNIFSAQHPGLFKEAEARLLIDKPSAEWGIPLQPLAGPILAMGGLYPFFLQMACSSWYEYLEMEELKARDFVDKQPPRDVIQAFKEEAEPHFEYIWETLPREEQAVFKGLLSGKNPETDSVSVDTLEKKGYLTRTADDTLKPFSQQFAAFLKRRIS
jgi:class 3 adenylate cyclase